MILGALIGLLVLVVLTLIIAFALDVTFKPYTTTWVLFGAAGALIGHFLG